MSDSNNSNSMSFSSFNSPPPPHHRVDTAEPRSSPLLTRRQIPLGPLDSVARADLTHDEDDFDRAEDDQDMLSQNSLNRSHGNPNHHHSAEEPGGLGGSITTYINNNNSFGRSPPPAPELPLRGVVGAMPTIIPFNPPQSQAAHQQQQQRQQYHHQAGNSPMTNDDSHNGNGDDEDDTTSGTVLVNDGLDESSSVLLGNRPAWKGLAPATDSAATPLKGGRNNRHPGREGNLSISTSSTTTLTNPFHPKKQQQHTTGSIHRNNNNPQHQQQQSGSTNRRAGGGGGLPGARSFAPQKGPVMRFDVSTQVSFGNSLANVNSSASVTPINASLNSSVDNAAVKSAMTTNGGAPSVAAPTAANALASLDPGSQQLVQDMLDEADDEIEALEARCAALEKEKNWYKEELDKREQILVAFRAQHEQMRQTTHRQLGEIAELRKTVSELRMKEEKREKELAAMGSSSSTKASSSSAVAKRRQEGEEDGEDDEDEEPPAWWFTASDEVRKIIQQELTFAFKRQQQQQQQQASNGSSPTTVGTPPRTPQ